MKTEIRLGARLAAAASMVGDGTAADIGTDHAYLPVFLSLTRGMKTLASDIGEGPCRAAREHVEAAGAAGLVSVVCRPGLDGIEAFTPDNIVIAGMGGELIASILDASDYPKTSRCRLVLQPMSMQDVLRAYLYRNGYCIDEERVVKDEGKFYQLIAAHFDGCERTADELTLRLGPENLARVKNQPTADDLGWLHFLKNAAERRVRGRAAAVSEVSGQAEDLAFLKALEPILNGGQLNADH